ncbi:hypothetical protein LDE54_11750, partial [Mycobacterium tuberculosis]
IWTRQQEG